MCHLFILFYHINYSFYKMFRCSGKSPASSGIGKYCSVLWWRWHYLFFSDRNSRWILHIEIICDDVYTYHLHQPKQKKCQSKNSFISHHLTLHLKQIQIYLSITRTFGIFSTSFSDQQKDLLRFPKFQPTFKRKIRSRKGFG